MIQNTGPRISPLRSRLPFDVKNPPEDPPQGANPVTWRLSHGLLTDHRANEEGICPLCKTTSPCDMRRLALRGLLMAIGR